MDAGPQKPKKKRARSDAASADPRARVLVLLRKWGVDATAFQMLEQGFRYWFDGDDACVGYADTGGAWVVAGAPIASPETRVEVAARFVEAAKRARRRVSFFAVDEAFAAAAKLTPVLVGEQATWDPREWQSTLAARKSVREQLRRARAKGVTVRRLLPEEMTALDGAARRDVGALATRWLASRAMPQLRFLVDLQLFDHADERRYFVAEREGTIVGFLGAAPVHARAGWLFEDLLRHPRAPNGTTELLFDGAMRAVAAEGSEYVTLGLAPLAGPVGPVLSRVRRWASTLYDFDGLRAFKAKLAPRAWTPMFVAYPPGASPFVTIYDVLRAFAGSSLLAFGIRATLRGPRIVLRALTTLLVPWTLTLAVAPRAWFPEPWIQWGWVFFDGGLTLGLFVLLRRWRNSLARALAWATTLDVALTIAEALYHAPPHTNPLETWAIRVIACTGPTLGTLVLWGAVRRLEEGDRAPK